jgi:hypothetical protein
MAPKVAGVSLFEKTWIQHMVALIPCIFTPFEKALKILCKNMIHPLTIQINSKIGLDFGLFYYYYFSVLKNI